MNTARHPNTVRYVSEAETAAAIDADLALAAARAAFIASVDAATLAPAMAHGSDPRNVYTFKPAASATHAGFKIGTYWPGNDVHGLPRHSSTVLLFDQDVGRIGALLEVGEVNAYRTAAADALAVDQLARRDATSLAVFGTGHQAGYDVRAIARVRPIERVLVVGRDADRVKAMVEDLRADGINAAPASAAEACEVADVVTTVTTATVEDPPLFEADWIRPGTHISCMGADSPGKRELPPAICSRAVLFCDIPSQARRIGEFQHAPADADVVALGEVLAGSTPGRRADDDITIFDSSGFGLQDLYVAISLLDRLDAR